MLMLILNVVYVLVAVAMVALILMQRGSGAAAGSGFGAGASGTVFGARGASNFLSKSTKWLAVVFFGISLFMAWYAGHGNRPAAEQDLGLMSARRPVLRPLRRANCRLFRRPMRSRPPRFRPQLCRLRRNLRFLVKKSLRKAPRKTEAGYNTRRIGKIV